MAAAALIAQSRAHYESMTKFSAFFTAAKKTQVWTGLQCYHFLNIFFRLNFSDIVFVHVVVVEVVCGL